MLVALKGSRITQFKPAPAKGGQMPKRLNNKLGLTIRTNTIGITLSFNLSTATKDQKTS
jgi:hypothetical protein